MCHLLGSCLHVPGLCSTFTLLSNSPPSTLALLCLSPLLCPRPSSTSWAPSPASGRPCGSGSSTSSGLQPRPTRLLLRRHWPPTPMTMVSRVVMIRLPPLELQQLSWHMHACGRLERGGVVQGCAARQRIPSGLPRAPEPLWRSSVGAAPSVRASPGAAVGQKLALVNRRRLAILRLWAAFGAGSRPSAVASRQAAAPYGA